jgi:pSer/pThr/pTyr-binding forkhead associated (FHA) protein
MQDELLGSLVGTQAEPIEFTAPPPPTDVAIALYVMGTGEILPLEGRSEFTLGRSAEGQPVLPDVDLAPFHAYESGVSRLHASITLGSQQSLTTDLGSANGTRLNGLKIPPHKPVPVKHGDILTLGRLKIQILIRR